MNYFIIKRSLTNLYTMMKTPSKIKAFNIMKTKIGLIRNCPQGEPLG